MELSNLIRLILGAMFVLGVIFLALGTMSNDWKTPKKIFTGGGILLIALIVLFVFNFLNIPWWWLVPVALLAWLLFHKRKSGNSAAPKVKTKKDHPFLKKIGGFIWSGLIWAICTTGIGALILSAVQYQDYSNAEWWLWALATGVGVRLILGFLKISKWIITIAIIGLILVIIFT